MREKVRCLQGGCNERTRGTKVGEFIKGVGKGGGKGRVLRRKSGRTWEPVGVHIALGPQRKYREVEDRHVIRTAAAAGNWWHE